MRLALLALLPLALAACGGESTGTDRDTMPAPASSDGDPSTGMDSSGAEDAGDDGEGEENEAENVTQETVEGAWASTNDDRGDPMVSFGPEGGDASFQVICREAEEASGNMLILRRVVSGEEADPSIGVITSAGNGYVEGAVQEYGAVYMAAGAIQPSSSMAAALANADGDMRVRNGSEELVIPAGEELQTLVTDCRPDVDMRAPGEYEDIEVEDPDDESED